MTLSGLSNGLIRFSRHPATRIFVGLSLLIGGGAEVYEDLTGEETALSVYHGVTLLGLQHVIHSLGELIEGLTKTHEGIRPEGT